MAKKDSPGHNSVAIDSEGLEASKVGPLPYYCA
jgi:hypothetical protein